MMENTSDRKIIVKLATAYRINFPRNEKSKQIPSPSEKFENGVVQTENFSLTDISKSFKIMEHEDVRSCSGGDEMMWDKVFMKLRPPSKSPKGKSLHSGVKFLNRTCEEIVDIIKPFSKNDKQENDGKRKGNESCRCILQDSTTFGNDKKSLEINVQTNETHLLKNFFQF